jgi:Domain of unknown function (DUF4202)
MLTANERRERAIAAFRAENARDPQHIGHGDRALPRELLDAERLAVWIERLEPQASEPLRLAGHCQHLRRWELPRSEFDLGRIGYLKWRKALARFHADQAALILRAVGYGDDVVSAVRQINLKQDMQANPDVQTMEDALCLSFLEHELEEFSSKHPDEKVVDIIAKTWGKMSERAHRVALTLALSARCQALVGQALSRGAGGADGTR